MKVQYLSTFHDISKFNNVTYIPMGFTALPPI